MALSTAQIAALRKTLEQLPPHEMFPVCAATLLQLLEDVERIAVLAQQAERLQFEGRRLLAVAERLERGEQP